ncbi:TPA: DUF3300 domain-containing protein [Escherichia coli]|nr:DUF3300 domain-containing protein [Escherichia coli]HCO3630918.1 DUF3300 domain-containing protein [Escherichia coli]HDW3976587.1 DUF3300 domain-containing protein [Escherichia coli]HDW4023410.1 DUF3300 domain-containing protein [Escherichia coli]
MKMTLPFKPHVLALICSAGLCAASTGLYIKSRTVEAPVEPQSTQQTAPDITAVTLPATVSAPPVTPAVVKSAFSTAQIDQWVAPVALYPDSLLSQVLMASTYPANVAQAVQWSHDNPLKQGDAAIQAVSDQPWDASVKSLVPYHDQDMAKRFHQTDVNGGMSATQLPAPTRDSQRQAAASQFQQRTHAAPVITRDTQRQAAAQRFNEAEHYGSYDDFRDFSRRQPLTQQQKDAARQRYQSASPEQRQAVREKMQTNPQNQQRREAARERIQSATPEQRQVFKEKVQQRPLNQQQRDNARQRIQSASPEQRQVFREKVQESRPQRLNDSNHTVRLNNEQRSAVRERLSERGARRQER